MKIELTPEGGLCITPESKADWLELSLICSDIGNPSRLAESLTDLMDKDSEWEEYVMPDLEKQFNDQCCHVTSAIEDAQESKERAVFISPQEAEKWYGSINQARTSLEARYQLSHLDDLEDADPENISSEILSAYSRDRFYLFLLSILLEHVISA